MLSQDRSQKHIYMTCQRATIGPVFFKYSQAVMIGGPGPWKCKAATRFREITCSQYGNL